LPLPPFLLLNTLSLKNDIYGRFLLFLGLILILLRNRLFNLYVPQVEKLLIGEPDPLFAQVKKEKSREVTEVSQKFLACTYTHDHLDI
jgi:hypothetical protein